MSYELRWELGLAEGPGAGVWWRGTGGGTRTPAGARRVWGAGCQPCAGLGLESWGRKVVVAFVLQPVTLTDLGRAA